MRFILAKCSFSKAGKIEREFKKIKSHIKMQLKSAIRLEKKRTDIFPVFGVIKREFENMKWHVKMHEKMPFN